MIHLVNSMNTIVHDFGSTVVYIAHTECYDDSKNWMQFNTFENKMY